MRYRIASACWKEAAKAWEILRLHLHVFPVCAAQPEYLKSDSNSISQICYTRAGSALVRRGQTFIKSSKKTRLAPCSPQPLSAHTCVCKTTPASAAASGGGGVCVCACDSARNQFATSHRPAIIKRTLALELCGIIIVFLHRYDTLMPTSPVRFDSRGSQKTGAISHIRGGLPKPCASCIFLCNSSPKQVYMGITCCWTARLLYSLKRFWELTHLSVEPCCM